MTRKQIDDLPKEVLVEIRTYPRLGEIEFTAVDDSGQLFYGHEPHPDDNTRVMFRITVDVHQDPTSGKEVWRICASEAHDGWGPFIYDLVIEAASSVGLGAFTGTGLNPDSIRIWQKYKTEREDVVKHFLAEDHPWRSELVDPRFPFVLYKEPNLLYQLEQAGRIVNRVGQDGF